MAYTYDEQIKRLKDSGLYDKTSEYDKGLIAKNPDFGTDVYENKLGYQNAQTDAERQRYNDTLNARRAVLGSYTGGGDGLEYNPTGNSGTYPYGALGAQSGSAQSRRTSVSGMAPTGYTYNPLGTSGGAGVPATPAYQSPYIEKINSQIGRVGSAGKGFSYNHEYDPTYQALSKAYQNNAAAAGKNTLARAAAMTGGAPSTYAVQAATAAEGQILNDLALQIPALGQQAYNRYADARDYDQRARMSALNALMSMEDQNYGMYRDYVGDRRYEDETGYSRGRDALGDRRYDDETAYEREWRQRQWDMETEESQYNRALKEAALRAELTGDWSGYDSLLGLEPGAVSAYQAVQAAAKSSGGGRRSSGRSRRSGGSSKKSSGEQSLTITNRHGDSWVQVPGYGRVSYDELETLVDGGRVSETIKDGEVTYKVKR